MNDKPPRDDESEVSAGNGSQPYVVPGFSRTRLPDKSMDEVESDQFTPPPLGVRESRPEFKPTKSKDEDLWGSSGPGSASRGRKRDKKKPKPKNYPSSRAILVALYQAGFRRRLGLVPVLLLFLLAVGLAAYLGRLQGAGEVRKETEAKAAVVIRPMTPAVAEKLRLAMTSVRSGEFAKGEQALSALEGTTEAFPSLTYLAAMAALQNGQFELADKKAEQSIAKNERVSDALALRAVVATQDSMDPNKFKMADPIVRSDQFLRQAIAADPSNPYPHFELANLLRFQRKSAEAMDEIRLARALLNPMDSHLVMEITEAFLSMEYMPTESLPTFDEATGDSRTVFPAAYAEMRRGNFDRAAALLRVCEKQLSPDTFDYLVNDLALRKYADQPALAPFYGR